MSTTEVKKEYSAHWRDSDLIRSDYQNTYDGMVQTNCEKRGSMAKQIVRQGIRLSGRDIVQSNRSRVQRKVEADYDQSLYDAYGQNQFEVKERRQFCSGKKYLIGTTVGDSSGYLVVEVGIVEPITYGRTSTGILLKSTESEHSKSSDRVLETLEGFLDQIEGDAAFVTLKNEQTGEEFVGQYDAGKLAKLGIQERRRFICQTVETNGEVEVKFTPIQDAEISPEEQQEIDRRLELLLAEDNLDGDY